MSIPRFRADEAAPARYAAAITPHASNPVPGGHARSVYVGGAGDITVVTGGGDTVTFKAVPAGAILPVYVTHVRVTGTTATNLIALR